MQAIEQTNIGGIIQMSNTITKILMSILVFVLMTSSVSAALPLTVSSVKIDDQVLTVGSTARLNIERDQEFEVRLVMQSTEQLANVEVQASVSGYEYNDVSRIFDSTQLFDMAANVSYTKRLTLRLPSDADADNYKLRIVVSDRNNDALVQNFDLRVDAPRHLIRVDDVSLFSGGAEGQVVSGEPLLVNVRVKNMGERNEEDVKVRTAIPQLGLVGTKYIDTVRADKSEETGNIYFRLPQCAAPGVYPVVVEASYDNSKRTVSDTSRSVTVLKNEACDKKQEEKRVVVVEVQTPPQQQQTQPVAQPATEQNTGSSLSKVRSALEIFLVVLFAIFIVVGIIVFFSRLMHNDEDDE